VIVNKATPGPLAPLNETAVMAGCDADATTAIPMIMAMVAPGHHGPLAMMVLSHSWPSFCNPSDRPL
jgi:hypothetical protein